MKAKRDELIAAMARVYWKAKRDRPIAEELADAALEVLRK